MAQRVQSSIANGTAAMSFIEIARALGYRDPEGRGKKTVFMIYHSGMRKIRKRPASLRRFRELVEAQRAFRRERER